jgi:predicted metal-dependent enzyme (double-stranded beta helix superfamily)
MTLMPHNHNMWAIIGVYQGREDNIFWRRIKDDSSGTIEAAGARSLGPGDVQPLGRNIIHSVTNPTSMLTGAIHVYGGDFFEMERSEWDPEALEEHPYDIDKNLKIFEDSNAGGD